MFRAIKDLLTGGSRKRHEEFMLDTMAMMKRGDDFMARLDSFTRHIGFTPEEMSFDYKTSFFLCTGLHEMLDSKGLMNNVDAELMPTDIHQKAA